MLSHVRLYRVGPLAASPQPLLGILYVRFLLLPAALPCKLPGSTQAHVQIASKEVCMVVPLLKDGSYIAVASSITQAIGPAKYCKDAALRDARQVLARCPPNA